MTPPLAGKRATTPDWTTGPYYPDVVGLTQDLMKGRVFNLDALLLDGRLPTGGMWIDPQLRRFDFVN